MKNQYNNLVKILEKGSCVVVKSDNSYCSILNHKNRDGDYRTSDWWDSIEKSKQWIGLCNGNTREYWDDIDLEIVEVYRPEEKLFEVGDEVRISDKIKETECWEDIEDDFPEMKGKIGEVCFDKLGKSYIINCWCIGHEFLAPFIEDDDEVEKAIKLLEEKGYKIIRKCLNK